jgi:hypothetical protein
MKTVKYYVVMERWYNLDSCSPGSAIEYSEIASFTSEEIAKHYAAELMHAHKEAIKIAEKDWHNQAPEETEFFVDHRSHHIYNSISKFEEAEYGKDY